jgi:hypothetical protein
MFVIGTKNAKIREITDFTKERSLVNNDQVTIEPIIKRPRTMGFEP